MKFKQVDLRCDCGLETLVFSRYWYGKDCKSDYSFIIQDSYRGKNYRGFFGRFKRAWHAFKATPLIYNSVDTEDNEKVTVFLKQCLELMSLTEPVEN